jgi:hypothetical protein
VSDFSRQAHPILNQAGRDWYFGLGKRKSHFPSKENDVSDDEINPRDIPVYLVDDDPNSPTYGTKTLTNQETIDKVNEMLAWTINRPRD